HDAAAECGDPLAGYPLRVDDQAAGDLQTRRAARLRVIEAQIEPAGQLMFSPLDLQAADGPPSGRQAAGVRPRDGQRPGRQTTPAIWPGRPASCRRSAATILLVGTAGRASS